jgi:orotate phosphoribosyltransferase
MNHQRKQLLDFLKARSFKEGIFKLASGDSSKYYIDGKMAEVCSEGAHLIGEVLYDYTEKLAVDAIGGLEAGAIPLVTAAVISYHQHGRQMEGFWVRDKLKDHGTQKIIEGNLKPNSRVVIVDDVVTKGQSVIKAVMAVKQQGCRVPLVVTLVDRLCGAAELFKEHGVEDYRPIFTIRDFGVGTNVPESAAIDSRA